LQQAVPVQRHPPKRDSKLVVGTTGWEPIALPAKAEAVLGDAGALGLRDALASTTLRLDSSFADFDFEADEREAADRTVSVVFAAVLVMDLGFGVAFAFVRRAEDEAFFRAVSWFAVSLVRFPENSRVKKLPEFDSSCAL
jgi:hypothetical protein